MSMFSKNVISNNKNTVATIGERNIIDVSQKLSEVKETSLTTHGEEWSKVVDQIAILQKIVRELPDENEDLRDQQLVPGLSKAKQEAKSLQENPEGDKKGFIEAFKSFCDTALKVTELAGKVAPIVGVVAKLIGLPIP